MKKLNQFERNGSLSNALQLSEACELLVIVFPFSELSHYSFQCKNPKLFNSAVHHVLLHIIPSRLLPCSSTWYIIFSSLVFDVHEDTNFSLVFTTKK